MAIRKQTKSWKTRHGARVRVCDMTDTHLLNAEAMCRRNYFRFCDEVASAAYDYAFSASTPDGASMAAEQAADSAAEEAINQDQIGEWCPVYPSLLLEIERRNLTLKGGFCER